MGSTGAPLRLFIILILFITRIGLMHLIEINIDPVFMESESAFQATALEILQEDGNTGIMYESSGNDFKNCP